MGQNESQESTQVSTENSWYATGNSWWLYEGVSKSFWTGCLEQELQM